MYHSYMNPLFCPSQDIKLIEDYFGFPSDLRFDDYLQPASLDIPIGDRVYLLHGSFTQNRFNTVLETAKNIIWEEVMIPKEGFVLVPEGTYLIPSAIMLYDMPYDSFFSTRSTIGRLGVHISVIGDRSDTVNQFSYKYTGRIYFLVNVQKGLPIRIHKNSRLVQMRIATFTVDSNASQANKNLTLYLDLNEVCGYRLSSKNFLYDIDIEKQDWYDVKEHFIPLYSDDNSTIIAEPGELYIFRSREFVQVPNDECMELTQYNPHIGEFYSHFAGFFDPGFGLDSKTNAVFEIKTHQPFVFRHGQNIAKAVWSKLVRPTEKPYTGTYQGQNIRLSKVFKSQ